MVVEKLKFISFDNAQTKFKKEEKNDKKYSWISTFPSDTPFFTKKELKNFYKSNCSKADN